MRCRRLPKRPAAVLCNSMCSYVHARTAPKATYARAFLGDCGSHLSPEKNQHFIAYRRIEWGFIASHQACEQRALIFLPRRGPIFATRGYKLTFFLEGANFNRLKNE